MKKQIKLSIQKPCSQKFENFQVTNTGGFCNSCSKNVIDFTKMTDGEILNYFKDANEKTCGRFSSSQLKLYNQVIHASSKLPQLKWLGAGMLGFSILLPVHESLAQTSKNTRIESVLKFNKALELSNDIPVGRVIKGRVIDETAGEPVPGLIVMLKGTTISTQTDVDGEFTFNHPVENGDILVFTFIGYTTVEIEIGSKTPSYLNVAMDLDIAVLGEVAVEEVYSSKESLWDKLTAVFK